MTFFEEEARKLESSTRAAIRSTATRLQKVIQKETFTQSRARIGSSLRVKVYHFDTGSRINLSLTLMKAFSEGTHHKSRTNSIILLTDGQHLGFKRINHSNTWATVWTAIQKKSYLTKVSDGIVVVYNYRGRNYAIYKFQKLIRRPKLSIQAISEEIASSIPNKISQNLEKLDER